MLRSAGGDERPAWPSSRLEQALDAYEGAKARLAGSTAAADITVVTRTLADGRPAHHDVEWQPTGGVPRDVPVCFRDLERLAAGQEPDIRLVRVGNRRAPWFASGPSYAAWAQGWYADLVDDNRIAADRLTMTYGGTQGDGLGATGPPSGPTRAPGTAEARSVATTTPAGTATAVAGGGDG